MPGAFFEWLVSVNPACAQTMKRHGVNSQSSRLHALLRGCTDRSVRAMVKRLHREWRQSRVPKLCITCEGSGVVYEIHDFCEEAIGCQDCMGSGKA
jgi:hypothetical protein